MMLSALMLTGYTKTSHAYNYTEVEHDVEYIENELKHIELAKKTLAIDDLKKDYVNPFASYVNKRLSSKKLPNDIDRTIPDYARKRETLEQYALDDLKMVGTILKKGKLFALVRDPDKRIHVVEEKHYLGRNSGQIINVSTRSLRIKEWIKVDDKWQQHIATVYIKG